MFWQRTVFFGLANLAAVCRLSCSGSSTSQLLDGDFLPTSGQIAATLLVPNNNANMTLETQFLWTAMPEARQYRIEISTTSEFSQPILRAVVKNASYTIAGTDLIGQSTLAERVYYWRVATGYPRKEEISSVFKITLYDKDVVYVDNSSASNQQLGNLTAPFKSIQAALNFAAINKKNKVFVSKGDYPEFINLALGVSLQGGYDAAAGWVRNISLNLTRIINSTGFITVNSPLGASAATGIDGFTILNTLAASDTFVIYNNGASPTISNNVITGGGATGGNYAIYNSGASPLISGNTIIGGSSGGSTSNYGIYNVSGSAPMISGNTITGGTGAGGGFGVHNTGSNPTIIGNSIRGGAGSFNHGVYNSSSSPVIYNNSIIGGNGGSNNWGIYNNLSSPLIANNTITGGTAGTVSGIDVESSSFPVVKNNIIFCTTGSTLYGVYEGLSTSDPAAFQNNDLFGCTIAYRDENTTNYAFVCTDGQPGASGGCGVGVTVATITSGNVSINNAGNQLFANQNGLDGNILTIADNDWHLTTNAAICDVRGGGLNLSSILNFDKDSVARTTGNPSGGCVPANTGATGWSIGAFESN